MAPLFWPIMGASLLSPIFSVWNIHALFFAVHLCTCKLVYACLLRCLFLYKISVLSAVVSLFAPDWCSAPTLRSEKFIKLPWPLWAFVWTRVLVFTLVRFLLAGCCWLLMSIGCPRLGRADCAHTIPCPVLLHRQRNPFAPVVPCHRVVMGDLSIGGFR